jgi:ATP-dependent DNA helicase RecG
MKTPQDMNTPIQYLKGVGPHKAALLARLGITTVEDLLLTMPVRYEDRRSSARIVSLKPGQTASIIGTIAAAKTVRSSRQKTPLTIFQIAVTDGSGIIKGKWFNQPFLQRVFKPGQSVVLFGTLRPDYYGSGLEIINPEYEILDTTEDDNQAETAQIHTGRIVPIYRLTEGLSQKQMRSMVHTALRLYGDTIQESLPADIMQRYTLPPRREAIWAVHFPPDSAELEKLNRSATRSHQRLSFDELIVFQIGLAILKRHHQYVRGIAFTAKGVLADALQKSLPFQLTNAQLRVLDEIRSDMAAARPMHRLIQGDVGSGKTIVALLAMLDAVECGYQAALMAPTEILAEQHYLNIARLVEPLGITVALQTSGTKKRDLAAIASGESALVVGTHALIQQDVVFKKLGLVIIDEQHRFGVMQRAHLRRKGIQPDTIVMTATPIPRTLALTLYGDLDYSVIDELPPNRSPIMTTLLSEPQKGLIYQKIEDTLRQGQQVYVVYPLIDESEKMSLKNAVDGAEALQKIFPHRQVGLIHGRLKPAERDAVMRDFKEKRIDILVATTVIEVGIDVPNATLMVIIHAERFGFAQLHQLRGRVGRGSKQSHCILLAYGQGDEARRRLVVMTETTDGFRIAEEDLALRGPGEFFGTRQSGLPDLKVANILRDAKIVEIARREAFRLLEADPDLGTYPALRQAAEQFWGKKLELFTTA